jgi:hypothetical protein
MKKTFLLLASFLAITCTCAYGTSPTDLFNQYTTIQNSGDLLTIGNVEYMGTYYWGTWQLAPNLDYQLIDAGVISDDKYFNVARVCRIAHSSIDIDRSEVTGLGLDFNLDNCETYRKFEEEGSTTYCCLTNNSLRLLGEIAQGATYIYNGFEMPTYLADGSSFMGRNHVVKTTSDGTFEIDMDFVISVTRTGNTWTEYYMYRIPSSDFTKVMLREIDVNTYEILTTKILSGTIE